MKFIGSRFTRSRRNGTELIVERLDRGFVNDAFRDKFAYSYEKHIQSSSLDHLPVVSCISSNIVVAVQE